MKAETHPNMQKPGAAWYEGLDGVRGIAVLLVFSVHYMALQTGSVGWSGVLTFFVLSGFLITGILYDNRDESHRFRNFYWRRALRIFPLFYFVWLVILGLWLAGKVHWRPILWLWPTYLGNFARFAANSTTVDHIPTVWGNHEVEIGHFWSLAVEEQFYLLWPLVVFLVRRRNVLLRLCAVVVVGAPLLRVLLNHVISASWLENQFLYRMAFSQADAFLLGGMLALLLRGPEQEMLRPLGRWLLTGSLAVIVLLFCMHRTTTGFVPSAPWMSDGGFTLIDLASAGLILCALQRGSWVYRATTWAPLSRLGRYSYGFYVYHVLLGGMIYGVLPRNPPVAGHKAFFVSLLVGEWVVSFLIVFAVSALSFHLLEAPFLGFKDHFRTRHANPKLTA